MSSILNSTIGFSCAGVFNDGYYLMERIEATKPQLLLIDVRLPDLYSVEAVKLIHRSYPKIKILLLADHDDDDLVFSAICGGASGYIFKNDSFENILEKLQAFKHGATLISSSILQK